MKKVYNKSRTYILPLLASRIELPIDKSKNTYLHTVDNFEDGFLHVIFKFSSDDELQEFNEYVKKHKSFISKSTHNTREREYLYSFQLDRDFIRTYRSFLTGKYSQISNVDKNLIKSFWENYYGKNGRSFIDTLKRIFDKSPILRAELEQKLGVTLPAEAELSSSITFEDEIYYGD